VTTAMITLRLISIFYFDFSPAIFPCRCTFRPSPTLVIKARVRDHRRKNISI
jgi:hypothetical protein